MRQRHIERHLTHRVSWLRASVLGANDGLVSTASLIVGVIASSASQSNLLLTGVAGLVAGAMSMAAGEYVSVYSQADTEKADLERERAELRADPGAETRELTAIYAARGLSLPLAQQVSAELMAHDAIGAHARDELGITGVFDAQPVQAALSSAASFAIGACIPLLALLVLPHQGQIFWIAGTALVSLAALGALAAHAGGANLARGAGRVALWGAVAMAVTASVGALFGAAI